MRIEPWLARLRQTRARCSNYRQRELLAVRLSFENRTTANGPLSLFIEVIVRCPTSLGRSRIIMLPQERHILASRRIIPCALHASSVQVGDHHVHYIFDAGRVDLRIVAGICSNQRPSPSATMRSMASKDFRSVGERRSLNSLLCSCI